MPFGLLKSATGRLEKVDIALATMGGVVEQQVADAIAAFERGDEALAQSVWSSDSHVDEHERLIERQVVGILEDTRPTGESLRRAMTAVKIAAEMERIGDLAKNVAKRTTALASAEDTEPAMRVSPVVARMGRSALAQFGESLDALFRSNPDVARAVRETDAQIDELYNSIFREILVSMSQYSVNIVEGTHLVFVAKNFERIGDHATNIAERVHYTLTGTELAGERPKKDFTSVTALTAQAAARP